MAWALVNSQNGDSAFTNGTSATLTKPTGVTSGGLLVAAVACDISAGGDPGVAAISGFTAAGSQYEPAQFQGSIRLSVMYKIATGSEPSSYSASWASSAAYAWGIAFFTGNAGTSPLDQATMGGDPSSGATNIVAPALTGLAASDDLLVCAFANPGGANPYTMPGGLTTMFNNNQGNTDQVFLGMGYLALSATSSSAQTGTASGGNPNAAAAMAFLAAGGGGGGGGATDDVAARGGVAQALILMRERASGLFEPVREILKPWRPVMA